MMPSTCAVTAALCIGVTMPFASMMYGTVARRAGTTCTMAAGRCGRSWFFLQAARSGRTASATAEDCSDTQRAYDRDRIIVAEEDRGTAVMDERRGRARNCWTLRSSRQEMRQAT